MFDLKGWVRLAQDEDRRLRDGHLWVYRNEIASKGGSFTDGDIVWVEDAKGRKLGRGFVNLNSLISVRLLTRGPREPFNEDTLSSRLTAALERRRHLTCDAKRLVNAEGDLLPGLIIDVYGGVGVAQLQILGWEERKDFLIDALEGLLALKTIVLRNDSPARSAEGLGRYTSVVRGELNANVVIEEHGVALEVDPLNGQKTGFYIDQRDNRLLALPLLRGRSVLDCCCYTGAWSIMCARAGATEVWGIDSSRAAIDLAERNAERNGVGGVTQFTVADVFDHLQHLAARKQKFGAIILDPPSLARSKKAVSGAERGYVHINRLALGLLDSGGVLVTCSCSHHISADRFREILKRAASLARKRVSVIKAGGQPEDHPSLLGLPETNYLKCFVLRVE